MAIIWAEGFEDDAWDIRGSQISAAVSTTYGTGGRRGVRAGDNFGATYNTAAAVPASGGEESVWWHFKINVPDSGGGEVGLLHNPGSEGDTIIKVSGSQWQIVNYDGGTSTGLFGSFATNTWYTFFIEQVYHATLGTFKVWINGTLEVNASSLTYETFPTTTGVLFGGAGAADIDSVYVMDLVLGDGSDSPSSAFPMDLEVHTLLPDEDGNTSGLTGSDGNQIDNFLLVDESNPDTADYCGGGTEGNKDTYSMGDLSSTTEAIVGVIAEAYSAKSDSGTKYMRPVIRTSSTDYNGTSVALSETYALQSHVWDLNPNTAAAWTGTQINGVEVGAEVRDS